MKYRQLSNMVVFNPTFSSDGNDDENFPVSFVPMAAVSEVTGRIAISEERTIGEMKGGYSYFQSGDVLVAKITPCFENGKVAIAELPHKHGFGSTEFHVIRPHDHELNSDYLFHFLRQQWVRDEGERKMTGSAGQRRVPKHFLEGLDIPLPPLEDQKRIATILDAAEVLREKRRQAIAKLDALVQAVFLEMFGDPVQNIKGWRRISLSEILSGIESGNSPVCQDRPIQNNEWGVLKLGAITWCEYDSHQNKALYGL